MRYAFLIMLLGVAVVLVVVQVFQEGFERGYRSAADRPAATSTVIAVGTGTSSIPGFRGPTGQPRIVGPSAPPPNY